MLLKRSEKLPEFKDLNCSVVRSLQAFIRQCSSFSQEIAVLIII